MSIRIVYCFSDIQNVCWFVQWWSFSCYTCTKRAKYKIMPSFRVKVKKVGVQIIVRKSRCTHRDDGNNIPPVWKKSCFSLISSFSKFGKTFSTKKEYLNTCSAVLYHHQQQQDDESYFSTPSSWICLWDRIRF